MATIFSHAIVAVALKSAWPAPAVPKRLWIAGALCAMAPDLDVVSFYLGIPYGHVLGHRGITHSILFAVLLGLVCTCALYPRRRAGVRRGLVCLYLSLATMSHALLDGLTNGGRGVAFFAPFENSRYFLPWRPIEVSPIGARFFSRDGLEVLLNEMIWIWSPAAALVLVGWLFRRARA
ncbi:MAG: metal-dependent hydrolase [Chthoniobacterales bacterium]|nr:metal-dependent hydrolase [Chthoniobacterales bacterium]